MYQDVGVLRERFHQVILGAGYSEEASQSNIAEWFDKYMQNIPEFTRMLTEYETGKHED